jgi:hypothetical protein
MIKYSESLISAHHNYLVNGMLTQAFVVGNPNSRKEFFLLADIVPPGEIIPRISARLVDEKAQLVLEADFNKICNNPGRCSHQINEEGFRILNPSGEALLEVSTKIFANGYLTLLKARLFDGHGTLRVEPFGESIRVHGKADLSLKAPFTFRSSQ